jgi:hypothetical protein
VIVSGRCLGVVDANRQPDAIRSRRSAERGLAAGSIALRRAAWDGRPQWNVLRPRQHRPRRLRSRDRNRAASRSPTHPSVAMQASRSAASCVYRWGESDAVVVLEIASMMQVAAPACRGAEHVDRSAQSMRAAQELSLWVTGGTRSAWATGRNRADRSVDPGRGAGTARRARPRGRKRYS